MYKLWCYLDYIQQPQLNVIKLHKTQKESSWRAQYSAKYVIDVQ